MNDLEKLHPELEKRVDEQERLGGIEVGKLAPNTKIVVETKNTIYTMQVIDPHERSITIQGGSYFPEATEAFFAGSSWGGNILKTGWIGNGMHMEIVCPKISNTIITSKVQKAKLIGLDWEYELWSK